MILLRFVCGTIEIRGAAEPASSTTAGGAAAPAWLPPSCRWDQRTACFRAPASAYAELVLALIRAGIPCDDRARDYPELEAGLRVRREPRDYQTEALQAWRARQGRGVVVLPTGAGKSYLAAMAIDYRRRATVVVAPTLDLVRQWYDLLRTGFGVRVGVIGGGEYEVQPLTVTTYDSAYLHMEHLGARFGLAVFDECHHLPGGAFAMAARCCLAPFRLGLTATPERTDGRDALLDELIGPIVFRRDIVDLAGDYLAPYETVRITVELSAEERREYQAARQVYRDYLRQAGIRVAAPGGWSEFIIRASQSDEGRRALQAHRRQRQLAFAASAKLDYLEHLLRQHRDDRAILFTQDNSTTYEIARRFLLPAITHQTKVTERSEILAGLADGTFNAVVTSKVLNEGVDVPAANVAIVVSGSASVREHVQRLGRVLRKQRGKRALLYELVTRETSETFTSEQRRDHVAYR